MKIILKVIYFFFLVINFLLFDNNNNNKNGGDYVNETKSTANRCSKQLMNITSDANLSFILFFDNLTNLFQQLLSDDHTQPDYIKRKQELLRKLCSPSFAGIIYLTAFLL